jgi:hypothetical protein
MEFRPMQRLRRWLLTGLATISLLFFLASAALWIRSYLVADELAWIDPPSNNDPHPRDWYNLSAFNSTGGIEIQTDYSRSPQNFQFFPPRGLEYSRYASGRYPWCDDANLQTRFLGFQFKDQRFIANDQRPQISSAGVTLPWATLCAVFVVLPMIASRSWSRRRKLARSAFTGRCANCRYDLRASPGRCPECGTIALAATKLPRKA